MPMLLLLLLLLLLLVSQRYLLFVTGLPLQTAVWMLDNGASDKSDDLTCSAPGK